MPVYYADSPNPDRRDDKKKHTGGDGWGNRRQYLESYRDPQMPDAELLRRLKQLERAKADGKWQKFIPRDQALMEEELRFLRTELQRRSYAAQDAYEQEHSPAESIRKGVKAESQTKTNTGGDAPAPVGPKDIVGYNYGPEGTSVADKKKPTTPANGGSGSPAATMPSGPGLAAGDMSDDLSAQASAMMYDPRDPLTALKNVLLDAGMNLGGPLVQRMLGQAGGLGAAFNLQGAQDPSINDQSNLSDLFRNFLLSALQGGTIQGATSQGLDTLRDPNFQASLNSAANAPDAVQNPLLGFLIPMLSDPRVLAGMRRDLALPGMGEMGTQGLANLDASNSLGAMRRARDSGTEIDWFKALLGG